MNSKAKKMLEAFKKEAFKREASSFVAAAVPKWWQRASDDVEKELQNISRKSVRDAGAAFHEFRDHFNKYYSESEGPVDAKTEKKFGIPVKNALIMATQASAKLADATKALQEATRELKKAGY